ncbi:MAG: TnpV protein [Selenomonadaceae bacterium]|nr:TnpV protein [Selenomonadaceae bacterium]
MEEKFCGVWGHLREEYLKANQPALYELMLEKNELDEYLTGYQSAYSNRAEKMAEKLAAERGVDDNLYKTDSLEWILAYEKIQEEVQSILQKEIQQ